MHFLFRELTAYFSKEISRLCPYMGNRGAHPVQMFHIHQQLTMASWDAGMKRKRRKTKKKRPGMEPSIIPANLIFECTSLGLFTHLFESRLSFVEIAVFHRHTEWHMATLHGFASFRAASKELLMSKPRCMGNHAVLPNHPSRTTERTVRVKVEHGLKN